MYGVGSLVNGNQSAGNTDNEKYNAPEYNTRAGISESAHERTTAKIDGYNNVDDNNAGRKAVIRDTSETSPDTAAPGQSKTVVVIMLILVAITVSMSAVLSLRRKIKF